MSSRQRNLGLIALLLAFATLGWALAMEEAAPPRVDVPPSADLQALTTVDPSGAARHDSEESLPGEEGFGTAASAHGAAEDLSADDGADAAVDGRAGDDPQGKTQPVEVKVPQEWTRAIQWRLIQGKNGGVASPGSPISLQNPDNLKLVHKALQVNAVSGSISGQVLDPWGAPIEGATVKHGGALTFGRVAFKGNSEKGFTYSPVGECRTDANGMFNLTVSAMVLGESKAVTIHAWAQGFSASEHVRVELDKDKPSTGHVLRLRVTGALEGRVLDGSGVGVPAARVRITPTGDNGAQVITATTDAAGRYYVGDISAGSWLISVTGDGAKQVGNPPGVIVQPAEMATAPTVTVQINPHVAGRIVDMRGQRPVKSVVFTCTEAGGKKRAHKVNLAADGSFAQELPPGRYDLRITAKGYLPAHTSAFVESGRCELGVITLIAAD